MFFCFILCFVSNKLFEGDNIYIYMQLVGETRKMVKVYTEQSTEEQKYIKRATLNQNQQENSNLIMPFLVQNDKNDYRPN